MKVRKLYNFPDKTVDGQVQELVRAILNPDYTSLPIHADNTAALLGGLTVGQLYRTAGGVMMVVF